KPELCLDCPREEILTKFFFKADFMFTDNDTVYGVQKHDMDGGKTEEPLVFDQLPRSGSTLLGVIVRGGSLYVGMEKFTYDFHLQRETVGINVYSVQFVRKEEARVVYSIPKQNNDRTFSFIGFARVPGSSEAVDIHYKSNSKWHSARISVIRSSNPRLFTTRIDEAVESQEIQGSLVRHTPGVDHFLVHEGDHYVLRRRHGLTKAATIRGCGKSLPDSSPIIFDRWSFHYIGDGITGDKCLIRCHPYLM
ncbi:hypothetical protein FOZ63_003726, partial [Perkinsus olseni]